MDQQLTPKRVCVALFCNSKKRAAKRSFAYDSEPSPHTRCEIQNPLCPSQTQKKDAVAHDLIKEYGSTAHPDRGFALDGIQNSYHAKRGARFRTLCAPAKHKKRRLLASFCVWLGHRDSNPGSDGVRVRCLTAWRYPY